VAPEAIAAAGRALGIAVGTAPDVTTALKQVTAAGAPARILICGSLYLAGTVLAENG